RTMVFFESPRRTAATLTDLAEAFGDDRAAALCRELTKTYEEVRRGALAELAAGAHSADVLGEVTLVVAGANVAPSAATPADLVRAYEGELAAGTPRREAMRLVAERLGVPRRDVYDAVLAAKQVPRPPA
ncbi:MAG: 16S rRNA (cytidine(1402)-2'-O)-methyltransferase, partial [Candidatus Nanopelagicales bacterium]